MNFNFRTLQIEDYEVYRALRLDCLKKFPEKFGSSHDEEAEILHAKFQKFVSNPTTAFLLGAFDGEKLIGIAGFIRADRRKTRHRGEIVQVYVDPDYAGCGVGSSLLRKLIEASFEIEGIEQLELSVVADNRQAVSLYEKFGFETYGVQTDYFKDEGIYWDQKFMQLYKDRYNGELKKVRS